MGYDVHKLVEGRDLIIGGVKIPHTLGLLGHSDADVTWNVYTHASYAHAEDITVPDKWKGAKAWLRLHQIYTNRC